MKHNNPMLRLLWMVCLTLAAVGMCSCQPKPMASVSNYDVIPQPQQVELLAEQPSFVLDRNTEVLYGPEVALSDVEFLIDYIDEATSIRLARPSAYTAEAEPQTPHIVLQVENNPDQPEGYTIVVDNSKVSITGGSAAGLFYGIQTLRKALPVGKYSSVELPAATIVDYPRFGYRGMHLDIARHFQDIDFIKKYIDLLALHNINTFHWHLVDDQGWRVEIKKYPLLTTISTTRKETVIGRNSGVWDGKPYGKGMFYTQEELREVVAYAAERHIDIIPEIDMPGHMVAVLAAYPELGCTGGPYDVWTIWGVSEDLLCAGNDQTIEFCKDILDEIVDIFPYEYIHIGGDECPKVRWEECPKCQARIESEHLHNTTAKSPEEALQGWFMRQMSDHLAQYGKTVIGWDEILDGGLAPNATVMSWRGTEGGLAAVKSGHNAIMTPGGYCYLDSYQDAPHTQPMAFGPYMPLEKVYSYNPREGLNREQAQLIYGIQGNLWVEYIPTEEMVEYMIYPRILAIAEIGWSNPAERDYPAFRQRATKAVNKLRAKGYNAFDLEKEFGQRKEAQQPSDHIAKGKPVTYSATAPFNEKYNAGGATALTDGVHGGWTYTDEKWQGFIRGGVDVTIDLGEEKNISSVSADFMQMCIPDVWMPAEVTISASTDSATFNELARIEHTVVRDEGLSFKNFGWEGKTKARYIRYKANSGPQRGWLFTDEIVVK